MDCVDNDLGIFTLATFHKIMDEIDDGCDLEKESQNLHLSLDENNEYFISHYYVSHLATHYFKKRYKKSDRSRFIDRISGSQMIQSLCDYVLYMNKFSNNSLTRDQIGELYYGPHYRPKADDNRKLHKSDKSRIPLTLTKDLAERIVEFSSARDISVAECLRRCFFICESNPDFLDESEASERKYKAGIGPSRYNLKNGTEKNPQASNPI